MEEITLVTITPDMVEQIITQDKLEASRILQIAEKVSARIPADAKHLNELIVELQIESRAALEQNPDSPDDLETIDLSICRVISVLSFTTQLPALADYMVMDEVVRIAIRTLIIAQEARKSKEILEANAAAATLVTGDAPVDGVEVVETADTEEDDYLVDRLG